MLFSPFLELIALSGELEIAYVRLQVAPQFLQNYGGKLQKLQKSAVKFVRTTSYRWQKDLNKIPLQ